MGAVVLSGLTQMVVGGLSDGKKMVFTDFVTDTGTTVGYHPIAALQRITEFAFYVKDAGDTATTFECTVSGNNVFVTAALDPTGSVLTTVTFGY